MARLSLVVGAFLSTLLIACSVPALAQQDVGSKEFQNLVKSLQAAKKYNVFLNLLKDPEYQHDVELSLSYVSFTLMVPQDAAWARYPQLTNKQKLECMQFSTLRNKMTLAQLRSVQQGAELYTTHPLPSSYIVKKKSQASVVTWASMNSQSSAAQVTIMGEIYSSSRVSVFAINNVLVPPKFAS